uniref:Phosphatidic acid phosphatase type 2/haloperoxidase domain-containing protein n=1 Tax=viral metagenome TaxID=1070528 RepID=A0A6C0B3Y7_9ZZZZ
MDVIQIVDQIGNQGPLITFLITSFFLLQQKKYLIAYLVFSFVNHYSNPVLKMLFKEPRPNMRVSKDPDLDGRIKELGDDKYGMPSYHAQTTFFSTAFLYLVQKDPYVLLAEFTICCITWYQRIKYGRHSVAQLLAGSIIGLTMAYVSYNLTKHYLRTQ